MVKATLKHTNVVVTLALTEQEVLTMITILNNVGGHPEKSMRKHAASVLDSLLNVASRDAPDSYNVIDRHQGPGSIYFKDGSVV